MRTSFASWKTASILLLHLVSAGCASAAPAPAPERKAEPVERYSLKTSHEKRVDNAGLGAENLYGTRNFRVVLRNVLYRGGGNNSKNRHGARPNRNPLPNEGLDNLCREGFDSAIYLYREGFETAPPRTECRERTTGRTRVLEYLQTSPYRESSVRDLLARVHQKAKGAARGEAPEPIYTHCWNGWHASGLLSAYALRQFCELSAEEAVAYWDLNTDGNHRDPNFDKIRRQIREFKPYPELVLSAEEQKLLCLPIR